MRVMIYTLERTTSKYYGLCGIKKERAKGWMWLDKKNCRLITVVTDSGIRLVTKPSTAELRGWKVSYNYVI